MAHKLADDYPQGAWWVNLSPLHDPDYLPQTVARVLGVELPPDQRALPALLERLHQRRLLLVLDNFEHLTDAAQVVGEMLDSVPDLHLLVTSRGPLHLRGEMTYQVAPLVTGDTGIAEQLGTFPATQLFLERAKAASPAFELIDDNAEAVAQILQQVGGLPLGIEMAASALVTLSAAELAEKLRGPGLLETPTGATDMPDRHHSLRSAIQVSHDLLEPRHWTAFARLGVFRVGFDMAALKEVLGEAEDPAEVLGALNDAGLIQAEAETSRKRFEILEPIRSYAAELLASSGEEQAAGGAHAGHYRALAAEAAPHLTRRDVRIWLSTLDKERGNLRAALTWSVNNGVPNLGLELATGLSRFWYLRGDLDEGRRWFDRLHGLSGTTPETLAAAHRAVGDLAYWQGDPPSAIESYGAAADLYRQLDATDQLAEVTAAAAITHLFAGDPDSAGLAEKHAVTLLEEVSQPLSVARAKLSLAGCKVLSGDLPRGLELLQEVEPIFESLGEVWQLGDTRGALARTLLTMGEHDAARAHVCGALEMFFETANMPLAALTLNVAAHLELTTGRPAIAVSLLAAASSLGDPHPRSFTSTVLGTDLAGRVGEALSPAELEEAWSRGQSMSTEDILALVMTTDNNR